MSLLEILEEKSIIVGLKANEKTEIIEELVDALEVGKDICDRSKVLNAVIEREKIMSTGIGDGIAIPHGKSDAVNRLVAALGTKKEGVDFETLDGEPAHVFFLLVSPPDISGPHIKALARISRLLKNDSFKKALLSAKTPKDAMDMIADEEKRHPEPGLG